LTRRTRFSVHDDDDDENDENKNDDDGGGGGDNDNGDVDNDSLRETIGRKVDDTYNQRVSERNRTIEPPSPFQCHSDARKRSCPNKQGKGIDLSIKRPNASTCGVLQSGVQIKEARRAQVRLLNRLGPEVALLAWIVLVWLSALRSTHAGVLIVDVGLRSAVLWLRIHIAVARVRGRQAVWWRRLPANRAHVRASIRARRLTAVRLGRRLQNAGWRIAGRVRCHARALSLGHSAHVRLRRERRRRASAMLLKLGSKMIRDWHAVTHLRAIAVQWRNPGQLSRGRH
jgi:hypothetical protein